MGLVNTKEYHNLIINSDDLNRLKLSNTKFIDDFVKLWNIYVTEESQYDRNESLDTIINSVHQYYSLQKNHIIYFVIGFYEHQIVSISRFVILEKNQVHTEKCVFVCGMTTNKNFRRKGFCSKCIKVIIKFAHQKSLPVVLFVKHGNTPAFKCYENNDFSIIGNQIDHHIMLHAI